MSGQSVAPWPVSLDNSARQPRPVRAMPAADGFAAFLSAQGYVSSAALADLGIADAPSLAGKRVDLSRPAALHSDLSLGERLVLRRVVTPERLTAARAAYFGLARIDPAQDGPDPRLIDELGAMVCLSLNVLPWRRIGEVTLVAIATPEKCDRAAAILDARFGRWSPVLADPAAIRTALGESRSSLLQRHAETRLPGALSCRTWQPDRIAARAPTVLAALLAVAVLAPAVPAVVLLVWATLAMLSSVVLKTAALIAAPRPLAADPPPAATIARLPTVSVIVPLYREQDIAPRLLARLRRIDYPRELLQVVLAVEECDGQTRAALAGADLPAWMQIVVVPEGRLRTKPRALNYALSFCRGSIIGIYDAEDAPEPDQIARVVQRLHERGPELGCVQGYLDYYNPHTNWLSRCFTIEYAAWFRVIMPGLERLGIPLPLGGTSLFVRRTALEEVGAWDAHNVTEDADLGIRLARFGYRTEMIASTTGEEANCRLGPWVRQRSRWIKGHLMTWAVHMRRPATLWRDLGPVGFIGYQALFLGAQSQFLLAPLLWSFWVLPFGIAHPVADALPAMALLTLVSLFVVAELLTIAIGVVGARRTAHAGLWPWAVTLHLYFPLATIAAWRAVVEMFRAPFYWAKTSHGHFDAPMLAQIGADAACPPAPACLPDSGSVPDSASVPGSSTPRAAGTPVPTPGPVPDSVPAPARWPAPGPVRPI